MRTKRYLSPVTSAQTSRATLKIFSIYSVSSNTFVHISTIEKFIIELRTPTPVVQNGGVVYLLVVT